MGKVKGKKKGGKLLPKSCVGLHEWCYGIPFGIVRVCLLCDDFQHLEEWEDEEECWVTIGKLPAGDNLAEVDDWYELPSEHNGGMWRW